MRTGRITSIERETTLDHAPPIEIPSEVPLVELGLGGFNVCALRQDQQVVCANANSLAPSWMAVGPLPL